MKSNPMVKVPSRRRVVVALGVLGVVGAICTAGCGPGQSGGQARRQDTTQPRRPAPGPKCAKNPPALPPRRKAPPKIWGCTAPKTPKDLRNPVARLEKPKPIRKFEPAVVDFAVRASKYDKKPALSWYRIKNGKVRLMARITFKKLGFEPSASQWRTSRELLLEDEKGNAYRLLLLDNTGKKRRRGRKRKPGYRLRRLPKAPKWLLPARLKHGPAGSFSVTPSGEVWRSRCKNPGVDPEEEFRAGDGCLEWAYGRIYPSFRKSKQNPGVRSAYKWKLPRPPGYRAKLLKSCLYCFRGRQGWVMYNHAVLTGIHHEDLHSIEWLGRKGPLLAVTVKKQQGDSPWFSYYTNLYTACRGYPVGLNVRMRMGPRPYLAYHRMYPMFWGTTLFIRYDGQLIGKIVTPRNAWVGFAPLPSKPAGKSKRR